LISQAQTDPIAYLIYQLTFESDADEAKEKRQHGHSHHIGTQGEQAPAVQQSGKDVKPCVQ
jgi:hypothetical protein